MFRTFTTNTVVCGWVHYVGGDLPWPVGYVASISDCFTYVYHMFSFLLTCYLPEKRNREKII